MTPRSKCRQRKLLPQRSPNNLLHQILQPSESSRKKICAKKTSRRHLTELCLPTILLSSRGQRKKQQRSNVNLMLTILLLHKLKRSRKLAESKKNEEKAAAEARQLAENEAKRKATLAVLNTKK